MKQSERKYNVNTKKYTLISDRTDDQKHYIKYKGPL